MNNERRKKIRKLIDEIERIKSEIDFVLDDEQYSFDNMPENLQCSERGNNSEDAIDCLSDAIDSIKEAIDTLNSIY